MKLQVIKMLNVVHLFHRRVIFQRNNRHIAVYTPPWHNFKNSIAVAIGLLYSEAFMNSHFHFLITMESATSQLLLQLPKQYSAWSRNFQ